MAHLAACCTRALCASRPPLHAQRNTSMARRGCVRGQRVVAAAARPPPPASGGSGSGSRPPSARQLARQQRVRQQAQDAWMRVQQRDMQRASRDGLTLQGLSVEEQTGRQAEAVAAELLMAGMTPAAVVELFLSRPSMATLEPQALAPKLASARAFLRGAKRSRASALNKLCAAAACAAVAQRSDAAFEACCAVFAELCAAATGSRSVTPDGKAAAIQLISPTALNSLLCEAESADLQAVFGTLRSHLGWSSQHAAAALLGLQLHQGRRAPAPLCTTAQHIEAAAGLRLRERGLVGSDLALFTQLHIGHWAATRTDDARAALQALEGAGLSRHLAAVLWLCCGPVATDPALLNIWQRMVEAGVPAQQLEFLGSILADSHGRTTAFVGSMACLHALLGGDWRAAADAAAAQPRLLQFADQNYFGVLPTCRKLAGTGIDPETLQELVREVKVRPWLPWQTVFASLEMLSQLLGSWQAAVEAALADDKLLHLPETAVLRRVVAGLSTAGLESGQLLRLASGAARYHTYAQTLEAIAEQLYGGGWRAAAQKCLQEPGLLRAPARERLWRALRILQQLGLEVANECGRERVLQFVRGGQDAAQAWQITVPEGTPAEERRAAAEAALKAEGFRAVSGQAEQAVSQLAQGAISGIRISTTDFELATWL